MTTCTPHRSSPSTRTRANCKWHFQFTPHDLHDWDSNHVPVLADVTIGGRARKVVMVANRNSFFYVLDRVTGKLILGKPYTGTQWARELGPDGKPIVLSNGAIFPGETKEPPCVPDFRGGTNFNPPSYDPSLQLFFVMARETCAIYTPIKQEMVPGRVFMSGGMRKLPEPDYGACARSTSKTGAIKWEFKLPTPSLAGVMSTASGLVFAGDNEGELQRVRVEARASSCGRIERARSSGVPRRRPSCSTAVSSSCCRRATRWSRSRLMEP